MSAPVGCDNRRVDFDSVADELYEVVPSDFVAARRAAVASAKEAGDTALAKELGGLRRPTMTGWALNVLVRTDPARIGRLLDLGAELRAAQQGLRSDEMRSLATTRAALLAEVTDRAAEVARERGHELSGATLREVGQSLAAAIADPDIGADLRLGRMHGAVSYSGFGPELLAVVPTPTPPPDNEGRQEHETTRKADEEARRKARARVADAERSAHEAASTMERTANWAAVATRRVEALRDELARAEQECRFADSAHRAAEDAAERAAAELTRAREAAADLEP